MNSLFADHQNFAGPPPSGAFASLGFALSNGSQDDTGCGVQTEATERKPSGRAVSMDYSGLRSTASTLRVELPPGTTLQPVDKHLLKEFWSAKPASHGSQRTSPFCNLSKDRPSCKQPVAGHRQYSRQSAAAIADLQLTANPHSFGLAPSRLARSVSAVEFAVNSLDSCVRAGGSRDERVRAGRSSRSMPIPFATSGPAPASLRTAPIAVRGSQEAGLGRCSTASSRSLATSSSQLFESEKECKAHGGKDFAMEKRVRGGQLLRAQSKAEPALASVLSLLDAAPNVGPQTPPSCGSSILNCSSAPSPYAGSLLSSTPAPVVGSLHRLTSLDASVLQQLDRALSATLDPLPVMVQSMSTGLSSGGQRIHKVRPLGAAAAHGSTLSLQSAMSRNDSTLFELAEEQASLAASLRPTSSGRWDCLAQLVTSGTSSLPPSLGVSPNPHQAGVSLATVAMACSGSARATAGGYSNPFAVASARCGSVENGGGLAGRRASRGSSEGGRWGGQSLPNRCPGSVQQHGLAGSGSLPEGMASFPFSSPEEFYMCASVLVEAKLPNVLPHCGLASP